MGSKASGWRLKVLAARRRSPIVAVLLCLVWIALAVRSYAAEVTWTKGDGDWAAPNNWSSNPALPGPNDDAVNPTFSRITHGAGDHTIKTFTGTGPFTLSGGSLSATTPGAGTFRVDSGFGFTIAGGTLRGFRLIPGTAGRPVFFDINSTSTLDNITSDANLELGFSSVQNPAIVRVTNGLTLNGTATITANSVMAFQGNQTLGGTGAVLFPFGSQRLSIEGDSTLTIAPDMELKGSSGNIGRWALTPGAGKLVNQGRIAAEGVGAVLTIDPASPALASVTNSGILQATIRATLNLNSHVTNTPTGQINADVFSRIQQNGVEITGGTINLDSDSILVPSASGINSLNGVKLNGNMDLATASAFQNVRGGLTLNGVIRIDSNSLLSFNGTQTISGPATFGPSSIVFGGAANNQLELAGGTLTLAANVSIVGNNGRIGSLAVGGGQIENLGFIAANVEGGTLRVEPPTLTNRGTLQATQGGTLALTGATVNNSGNIFAILTGRVNLNAGAVTNSGTIQATNGGFVNVNTNVNNTPQGNIAVSAFDARVNINGARITGGRITNTSGIFAFNNSQSNLLDGVTASGRFVLDGGAVRVVNGLTLNGNLDLFAGGAVTFQGNQTLGGAATITLNAGPPGITGVVIEGNSTLRLDPGVTIRGVGFIAESGSAPGATTLINEGTILSNAQSSQPTLTIRADAFTNATGARLIANLNTVIVETNGPVTNQGTISISSDMNFNQSVTQTAGEINLGLGGGLNMPAGKVLRLSGGTLGGVGAVTGAVINDGGTVDLFGGRFSTGVEGPYTQGPGGRVLVEIEDGDEPRRLRVAGPATLSGTLSIVREGGFSPPAYERYRIVDYATRSGVFTQYDGTSAGNGLLFATDYRPDGLDLVPAILGDANLDRAVGFPDLVAVAQNYNTTDGSAFWTRGDFNFDGNVNFADLVILAQRYNTTLAADIPGAPADFQNDWAAAIAQVPEPAALVPLATLVLCLLRSKRHTHPRPGRVGSAHHPAPQSTTDKSPYGGLRARSQPDAPGHD